MLILFVIYNIVLENLVVRGFLYKIIMLILVILNLVVIIKFKKCIKYKFMVILVYFLLWLFSKNVFQCFFSLSSMAILMVVGFTERKAIKILTICIMLFFSNFYLLIYFVFLLSFGTNLEDDPRSSDIYEDTHYYCDNNYEIYSYSAGAMDRFHYSIGKHYEILNKSVILSISYNERCEKTLEEYESFLKNHSCRLVGDKNESN